MVDEKPVQPSQPEAEEPPPLLGTWKNLYLFVLGTLVVGVVLLFALTEWAS